MKFKGIELKTRTDSEAELLVNVKVIKEFDELGLDEYVEELEDQIDELDFGDCEIWMEALDDDLFQVRCDDISLDEEGVQLLTNIYNTICDANFDGVEISIGVHSDEWFKDENGDEYNEDDVSLSEFLENIEY